MTASEPITILLPVSQLSTDVRVNTRPVDENWVGARVESFDPDAMGALVVSMRPDGQFVVLDGQHRAELARRAKGPDFEVVCVVHEGLSLNTEAALFRALNSARKVTPMQKFLARITEGEPSAARILAIAHESGWEIDGRQAQRRINAVNSLDKIFADDNGAATLEAVISVVTAAWGHVPDAVHHHILSGLGLVLRHHPTVALDDLVSKLAAFPGGPRGIVGDARGRRVRHRGSTTAGVAAAIVDVYNQRRRGANRLPDWK
jgi:hypothetical protein